MNRKNFKIVLDQITNHPEGWTQTHWHCGTTHCFMGWAELFMNDISKIDYYGSPNVVNTESVCEWLGINMYQYNYLSHPFRSLKDFRRIHQYGYKLGKLINNLVDMTEII